MLTAPIGAPWTSWIGTAGMTAGLPGRAFPLIE